MRRLTLLYSLFFLLLAMLTTAQLEPDCARKVDFNFANFESGAVPTCFCQKDNGSM